MLYYAVQITGHVPNYVGGDYGTALAISFSGIHFWFIFRTSRSRIDGMLTREAALDGMTSLLMLPTNRMELVLQSAIYPTFCALMMAVLLLPVYLFCVGLGGLTWLELISLYGMYTLAAVATPVFSQPALSGSVSASVTNPSEGPDTATSGTHRKSMLGLTFKKGVNAAATLAALPVMLFLFVATILAVISNGALQPFSGLAPYLPHGVIQLLPSMVISFPLIIARVMAEPLTWFGMHLCPLVPATLLVLAARALFTIRTAQFLSVGQYRELATLDTYRQWRTAMGLLFFAAALTVTGYLWPWAVRDGGAAGLVQMPGTALSEAGLRCFVYCVSFAAAVWTIISSARIGNWMRATEEGTVVAKRLHLRATARFLLLPTMSAAAFMAVCLVLSGSLHVPAGTFTFEAHMAVITLVSSAAVWAICRVHPALMVVGFITTPTALYSTPSIKPLLYLSPTIGLLRQASSGSIGLQTNVKSPLFGTQAVQPWLLSLSLLAVAMGVLGQVIFKVRAKADLDMPALDPTEIGEEVFQDSSGSSLSGNDSTAGKSSVLSEKFVLKLQRFLDNAVLTRDLRSWLRKRFTSSNMLLIVIATLALIAITILWVPELSTPGTTLARSLDPDGPSQSIPHIIAQLIGCCNVGMWLLGFRGGYTALPYAFGLDRRKTTLGFLLTTPLSTFEIVLGRAIAITIVCGAPLMYLMFVGMALCIPFAVLTHSVACFYTAFTAMGSVFLLFGAMSMASLALGTMFPNLLAVKFNGCIRLVILWFLLTIISIVSAIISLVFKTFDLNENYGWAGYIIISSVVILVGFSLTMMALQGMRKGDIDTKIAVH